jgi:hypothetical protein
MNTASVLLDEKAAVLRTLPLLDFQAMATEK